MFDFSPSAPVLILGASGFLGWNLLNTVPEGFKVLASHHHSPIYLDDFSADIETIQIDLLKPSSFDLITQQTYSGIIYAAAYSEVGLCDKYPTESNTLNYELSCALAKFAEENSIPFTYYSSDLVFDGKHPPYNDITPNHSLSLYGEQKIKAEQTILQNYPSACIFRLPLLYGEASPHISTNLSMTLKALKSGQTLNLFTDEFRTPVRAKRIADFSWQKLGQLKGLYNLGGPEELSRYEMGKIISQVYNLPDSLLIPTLQSDIQHLGPRPANCSLDSSKAFKKGYRAFDLKNELLSIQQDFPTLFQ